jgi:CRP-like cAMP-binding protein
MVVEAIHSISVLGSITFCLLDVVSLYLEEIMLLGYLPPKICYYILASYFEISLLNPDFEESLIGIVLRPDFITRIGLFRSGIASALLRIHLTVPLFAMLPYSTRSSIYIRIGHILSVGPATFQTVKVYG